MATKKNSKAVAKNKATTKRMLSNERAAATKELKNKTTGDKPGMRVGKGTSDGPGKLVAKPSTGGPVAVRGGSAVATRPGTAVAKRGGTAVAKPGVSRAPVTLEGSSRRVGGAGPKALGDARPGSGISPGVKAGAKAGAKLLGRANPVVGAAMGVASIVGLGVAMKGALDAKGEAARAEVEGRRRGVATESKIAIRKEAASMATPKAAPSAPPAAAAATRKLSEFESAFATARKSGAKAFQYRGKAYTTKLK